MIHLDKEQELWVKSNLPKIMDEKGFTVRSLESLSKISNVTILRARKDEKIGRCSLDTLAVLAKALDVRVCDLFDDELGQS